MPAVRGLIRRPLLNLGRADVLRYLKEQGVPYRTDSTNQDNQYLRNRLRNRLIPLLDELFPHWKKGVAAMAEIQSRTAAFLAGEAGRRVVWERVPAQGTDEVSPDTARKESIAAEGEWTGTDAAGVALRTNGGNFFAQPDIIREEALFQGIDLFKISLKDSGGGDGGLWREGDGLRSSEGDILPEDTPVRRSSLRLFSRNGTAPSSAPPMPPFVPLISPALDLGFCRISVKGASVIIGPGRNPVGEAGFSLLIKEPGIYKLNRLSLEVRSLGAFDAEKEPLKGFYAALPLILRPGFKGDVIIDRTGRRVSFTDVRGRAEFQNCAAVSAAVDERGAAAFIGAGPDGTIRVLCRDESAGSSGGPSFFVALSHSVCP
jgi:tRNA(Ile)-lysidine synthase